MGVVTNSVKDMTLGLYESSNLSKNMTQNLEVGSKLCPVVKECRDFSEGIAFGDA